MQALALENRSQRWPQWLHGPEMDLAVPKRMVDRLLREELVVEAERQPETGIAVLDRLLREELVMVVPEVGLERMVDGLQVLGAILLELTRCLGRRPRPVRMEGWRQRRPTCRTPCRKGPLLWGQEVPLEWSRPRRKDLPPSPKWSRLRRGQDVELLKDIPPCPQWSRPRRGQEVPLQLLTFPACLESSWQWPLQLLKDLPQQMQ